MKQDKNKNVEIKQSLVKLQSLRMNFYKLFRINFETLIAALV